MNTDKLPETGLNTLNESVNSTNKSNLYMPTLSKEGSVENTSAVASNVPRLSAREVSRSSCRGLLSRMGLFSARRHSHKKSRLKPDKNKREPNNLNYNSEFDSSLCAQRIGGNSQILDNSETFFSPSVDRSSNLLDSVLVSEEFADSPVASSSRQRSCHQKTNQELDKKHSEGLAGSNPGSDSTPLVDFKGISSTTSRRLRHPTDEKLDAMRYDSYHAKQQSRSLPEGSSYFATALQHGFRQVDPSKCLSGNSSFSVFHMLPTEVSPRSSGKVKGAHTPFTQQGATSSTTGTPACQTLRDAKSVLRKHAPASSASAASGTHMAINSVVGLSLHSFHPTNSFHSRSSSIRSRRACVRRGALVSDAEDSIQDRDLSMVGVTAVASVPPSVEPSYHGFVMPKPQHPTLSARTHEGLVDRSFRSFPKGLLDSACTPFNYTALDVVTSPSEQHVNTNYTCGQALQSIVMVPGSDPSFGQVRSPRLVFDMLNTSSITSFNPEETNKDISASERGSSLGSATGVPLRARIIGPKLLHRLSSRSVQSSDNSNTSDSDLEAEHQKKVDELLKLLTVDHKSCRSNSLVPDDPLSKTSIANICNSRDITIGGFARVDGMASASNNTMNCTPDLITGCTEIGLDPTSNSSSEEKATPNNSGWMCVGSLFSSQDWYMRMRSKKDDSETEKYVDLTSRGSDKDKDHNTNTCSCSGGSESIVLPSESGGTNVKSVLSSPGKVPLVNKSVTEKLDKRQPYQKTSYTHAADPIAIKRDGSEVLTNAESCQWREGISLDSKSNYVCSPILNWLKEKPQVQSTIPMNSEHEKPTVLRSASDSSVLMGDLKISSEKNGHRERNSVTLTEDILSISHEASILLNHEFNMRVSPTIRESSLPLSPVSLKSNNVSQTPVVAHLYQFHQSSSVPASLSFTYNRQGNSNRKKHFPDTTCGHSSITKKNTSSTSNREKTNKHSNKLLERVRLEPVIFSSRKNKRTKKKVREHSTVLPTSSNICMDAVGKHDKMLLPKSNCIDEMPYNIHTTTDVFLPALPYDHLKMDYDPTSSAGSVRETDPLISHESTLSHASYQSGDSRVAQDLLTKRNQARRRTIPHYTKTTKTDFLIDEALKVGSDSHVSPLKRESSAALQGDLLHITWPRVLTPTLIVTQPVTSPILDSCRKASLPQVKSAKLQPLIPIDRSHRLSSSKSKFGGNSKLRTESPGVVLPQWKSFDADKSSDTSK
ncbi:unnamed protein product [Phytomonas sp. Hart1]|nr:unnamed protein product [Phytomonas sp. Hart1]|eukprot:CCW71531.1 unnamed protein product [Phytomonas sp. isolate Hart1]